MKNQLTFLIGLIVGLILLAFLFLFQVRYDEVALVTTFGKADASSIRYPRPWPYFRWFPPIQNVIKFPTRLQLLEDQLEEMQTADGSSVIPRTYLAWRIEDPLAFYSRLENLRKAQDQIRPLLRNLKDVLSRHRLDELVNLDPQKLKLAQIEQEALAQLNAQFQQQGFGIRAVHFGIRRLVLPEQVTAKVFQRMKQTRQAMAQNARSEGENQAIAIRSEAQAVRRIILAFAENRAQAIRTQGMLEAAEYYKAFAENEELANFLRRLDTLKKILPHNATYVLPADQLGIGELLSGKVSAVSPASSPPPTAPSAAPPVPLGAP